MFPKGSTEVFGLHQHRLPSHRHPSDRRRVQRFVQPRAHSHQPVQVHRLGPQPNGEDHFWEAQLPVKSRHSLNLPAFVPRHCTFAHVQQVRTSGIIKLQSWSQINRVSMQARHLKLWLVKVDRQSWQVHFVHFVVYGSQWQQPGIRNEIIHWLD